MPRKQFNDGQEILFQDLTAVTPVLEMDLYDRLIYELMGRQQNVVFGNSFVGTYINGTTVQVGLGNGVYFDNTQVDPEPMTRLLRLAANTNQVITTPHATLNRIDLLCIQAARATTSTQTRNYKDPSSGVVSPTSQIVETDWAVNMQIVAGTASGSPTVPATPSGWVAVAQLAVTAVSGIASQAAITDVRPRFKSPNSWMPFRIVTANANIDLDDGIIVCNPASSPITLTLPAASLCGGKYFQIKNISTQVITVQCSGSDILDGIASQQIPTQYGTLNIFSDGTQFYLG